MYETLVYTDIVDIEPSDDAPAQFGDGEAPQDWKEVEL